MSAESADAVLAERMQAAVLGVPHVSALYASGGIAANMLDASSRVLGLRDSEAPRVRMADRDGVFTVELSIGVDGKQPAVVTGEAVHDAVSAVLATSEREDAVVSVTIVRIDSPLWEPRPQGAPSEPAA